MPNIKTLDFKKIGIIIVAIICTSITFCFLISQPVNVQNTTLVIGHFDHLDKVVTNGRGGGSISYNLYIQENKDFYKIAAGDVDCFDYAGFNAVSRGQLIKMYINEHSFFTRPFIVAVSSNNVDYLSFDCINQETDTEKRSAPFVCMIFIGLFALIIYKKEVKARLKVWQP